MPSVVAEVILKTPSGRSVLDAQRPPTADTIGEHRVPRDRVQEASDILERLGFRVVQQGVTSISVEGELETFEQVFQCALERRSKRTMPGRDVGEIYFSPSRPAKIPQELTGFVADIVFPEPPELFP